MKDLPCEFCQHFNKFKNGGVSCYAQKEINFYWYTNINEMMNHCPRGYRARKSGNNFEYYRDYNNVRQV